MELDEYKDQLIHRMAEARTLVSKFNENIRRKQTNKANEKRHDVNYKVGDLVWLYTRHKVKGLSLKMKKPWHGPFRIIELERNVNVRLMSLGGRKLSQLVHVSRLKKLIQPNRPTDWIDIDDDFDWDKEAELIKKEKDNLKSRKEEVMDDSKPEIEYKVKEVLDIRKRNGKKEYKIRWKGYSEDSDTWEPEENVTELKQVEDFHRQNGTWCEECDKGFVKKAKWKFHMKKNHGI
jgi:hypothetical protein